MRLAFCLFKYYPYGGLERDFLRIALACVKRGHEVQVFTMHWQGKIPSSLHVNTLSIFSWTNHRRALKFSQKVVRLLRENPFDLVIGFNRMAGLDVYFAADACYRAEIQHKHGIWYRLTPRYRIYAALERAIFSQNSTTEILLLNPKEKQRFIDYYQTSIERFYDILPGVGEDRERGDNQLELRKMLRSSMQVKDNELVILMVGSDFQRKGVDRAMQAVSHLPKKFQSTIRLWIVGEGNTQVFQQLAKTLDIQARVSFFGARDDLVNFYAAADLLLHTAYQETAGMVLIEALVAGLPVLVTANCGYATYIERANAGRVVSEPFQQNELTKNLTELLEPAMLATYRENALRYVKQHDLFHFEQHIVDIIETIAQRKRNVK